MHGICIVTLQANFSLTSEWDFSCSPIPQFFIPNTVNCFRLFLVSPDRFCLRFGRASLPLTARICINTCLLFLRLHIAPSLAASLSCIVCALTGRTFWLTWHFVAGDLVASSFLSAAAPPACSLCYALWADLHFTQRITQPAWIKDQCNAIGLIYKGTKEQTLYWKCIRVVLRKQASRTPTPSTNPLYPLQ